MPYVLSGDSKIWYEIRGNGPPLVLIEGLGYASWMWIAQINDLSLDHQLVIFDNRGVGKSDKPDYPYTMDMYAEDVKAVMNAVKIKKAHILGVSMGGMIAQWFALKYPSMVKSLILVSTHHGGPNIIPIPKETLEAMFGEPPSHLKTEKEIYAYKMRYAFSPGWPDKNKLSLEKLIELRLMNPQPIYAYMNQAKATLTFNVEGRLKEIKTPTLIIHGGNDRVVPVENSYKLHEKIERSTLVIFRDAGHLVIIEKGEEFNNLVRKFVREIEAGSFKPKKEPIIV